MNLTIRDSFYANTPQDRAELTRYCEQNNDAVRKAVKEWIHCELVNAGKVFDDYQKATAEGMMLRVAFIAKHSSALPGQMLVIREDADV